MVTNSEAGNAADLASKPQASGSRMRRCATAALAGAIPWSIYGIVEVVFVAIVPWVIHGTVNLPIVGWAYGVALLAIYPLAGAMLTAAVAAPTCLMRQKNTAAQDAGLWTAIGLLLLTLAAAASVVAAEQQHAEPGVAVACVFAAWRVRAEWRGHGSRIDFVANPWACALLIVGCAYLAEPRSSYGYIEAGIMLAAGLLVAVIGGAAASWIARRGRDLVEGVHPFRQVVEVLAVAVPFEPLVERLPGTSLRKLLADA